MFTKVFKRNIPRVWVRLSIRKQSLTYHILQTHCYSVVSIRKRYKHKTTNKLAIQLIHPFLSYRAFTNTRNSNQSNNDQQLLNHNEGRSKSHKKEIMDNEYPNLDQVKHPNVSTLVDEYYTDKSRPKFEDYTLPHPIWSKQELHSITETHKKPTHLPDYFAYATVGAMRLTWDLSTGYLLGRRLGLFRFSHRMWLLRVVFLETVAGVPGMMFGMVRHLNSLRRLERDRGWIISLISEAENERIHLLTAMYLYKPSKLLRYAIVMAQGLMCNFLFLSYLISPRFCHSLVGYLEEQAVHTYTLLVNDIKDGRYPEFNEPASNLAKNYWQLDDNATWEDVFLNIRADESKHRDVNHALADLADDPKAVNPFRNDE